MIDQPWRDEAACADPGIDRSVFFPERYRQFAGYDEIWVQLAAAKAICNGDESHGPCPVRVECLAYALAKPERFGVWGGKSAKEREAMRRRLAG